MTGGHTHTLAPDDVIRVKVKAELRKRMRAVRKKAGPEACAKRSEQIILRVSALEVVARARAVASFWPIVDRHEVDLRPLDASLRDRGCQVAYPAIDPATGAMTFRFVADPAELTDAGYGFAEPPAEAPEARGSELDVILVPALALDPSGHRIGYGAGYYDRTLPRFSPPAVTIGVAFDYQLIVEVPAMPGDVPVGWVVTDQRVLAAGS